MLFMIIFKFVHFFYYKLTPCGVFLYLFVHLYGIKF